jgi:hypothetical protein
MVLNTTSTASPLSEAAESRLKMPKETGWYFLSAVSSVFFIGGALGGTSWILLALNLLMLLLSLVSLVRPTALAWIYVMLGSVVYSSILLSMVRGVAIFDWAAVTLLGAIPTMGLWSIRPRRESVDQ